MPDQSTSKCSAQPTISETAQITSEIIWDSSAITAFLPEWQALADRILPGSFFLRPAVWQSWQRRLCGSKPAGLMVVYHQSTLIGVMPVMIRNAWRGPTLGVRYDYDPQDRRWLSKPARRIIPMRQMSPVLSLPATMLGPVLLAADSDKPAVISAMARTISNTRGWDMAVFPLEQEELALWQSEFDQVGLLTHEQILDRPGVNLRNLAPLDQVIARASAKGRQNYRRATAAAVKAGILFSINRDAPATMAILRDLANQSWKAKGRTGQHTVIPFDGLQGEFFDDLILGADKSQVVCAIATQDGTPIAIVMGVVTGRTLTTLLTYWNGCEPSASPGALTMGTIIDWAAKNRIDQVDFNSNAPWLKPFVDHREIQQNLLVFASGPSGRALATFRHAGLGLKSGLEKIMNRNPIKAASK